MSQEMLVLEEGDQFIALSLKGEAKEYIIFNGEAMTPMTKWYTVKHMQETAQAMNQEWDEKILQRQQEELAREDARLRREEARRR